MKHLPLPLLCACSLWFIASPAYAGNGAAAAPLSGKSLYQSQSVWTDDDGRVFRLSTLRGHSVVLVMFFTRCKVSCPLVIEELKTIRNALPNAIRNETRFVLVSMDAARDNAKALHAFRDERKLTGEGWILLQGDADGVTELAMLLGMKIKKDALGQFAHSNLITVLNKGGEIACQEIGLGAAGESVMKAIHSAAQEP